MISKFVQPHVQTFEGRPWLIYEHADPPYSGRLLGARPQGPGRGLRHQER